jgi:hypothetical protein
MYRRSGQLPQVRPVRAGAIPLRRVAKYLWAAPTTLLGLCASAASLALPRPNGPILLTISHRGFARLFLAHRGYCAITLGHVVLLTPAAPDDVLDHEMAHVRQSERWGPFFLPAYLAEMLAIRLRGGNPYWDNRFEAAARQAAAGNLRQG